MQHVSKPVHKRLAQQNCHPEPFASAHPERRRGAPKSKDAQDKLREGSLREILRVAQNDNTGWSQRKVYQYHGTQLRALFTCFSLRYHLPPLVQWSSCLSLILSG
jgi:hypothetical protein